MEVEFLEFLENVSVGLHVLTWAMATLGVVIATWGVLWWYRNYKKSLPTLMREWQCCTQLFLQREIWIDHLCITICKLQQLSAHERLVQLRWYDSLLIDLTTTLERDGKELKLDYERLLRCANHHATVLDRHHDIFLLYLYKERLERNQNRIQLTLASVGKTIGGL